MQASLFMISDQSPIASKNLPSKKGSAEEGHNSSSDITGLFSSLVKMLDEQKPHSGALGELNGSRKGKDKGEVDPTGQGKMFKGNGIVGHLKSTASKTVPEESDVKPDDGKVAKKKKTTSLNEVLEAASLLHAFGFETTEPVKAFGVSSKKTSKENAYQEKILVQKAETGNSGADLTMGKEFAGKGTVSADAILKAVNLLKALGVETSEPGKTSGAAIDKMEKLSIHSEKISLQKADAGNVVFEMTKGKEASAKGIVSADALLKAVNLLKALGVETSEPGNTSSVAGEKAERLKSHSEQTRLQKANAANISTDLNREKEGVDKILASSADASLNKGKEQLQIGLNNVLRSRYGQSPHEKKEVQGKNIAQTDRKAPFETTPSKAEVVYSNRSAAVDETKSDDMNGQSKKDHAFGSNAMTRKGADRGKDTPVDSSQEVSASKFKAEFENSAVKIGSRENNDEFLSHQADKRNESGGSNGNSPLILKNHVSSEKTPVHGFQSKEGAVFKQADQSETLNQIVKKAALHLGNGRSECRIDLKPESLGHLKMQISTENHQVTVKIVADNNVVKQIIEGNLNQLKADFQNQGMMVEKFDVSVGGDSRQGGMGYDPGAFHERAKAGDHAGYGGGRQFGQSEDFEQKDLLTRVSLNEGAVDFFA